ncbi:hypothetical protein U1Q18_025866, partial [Sarracenia purpurea var. burkii]
STTTGNRAEIVFGRDLVNPRVHSSSLVSFNSRMSLTQFAMVEELAFLVKDNLPCKHLVLSMEEAFINFLQDDPSSDGVLELEPMNAYNRLLLHRLADIFGYFSLHPRAHVFCSVIPVSMHYFVGDNR